MTKILHNPRCSKSRAAVKLLESREMDFKIVKYLDDPPSEKELREIVKMLGVDPKQLVRKGESLYKELQLGQQELTDKQWMSILADNPKLLERPIVIHNGKAAVGRPLERVVDILDN